MDMQKKWELMKFAYENYPKGTHYESLIHKNGSNEIVVSSGKFIADNAGVFDEVTEEPLFMFSGETWPTIVSDKNKSFEITVGGYDEGEGPTVIKEGEHYFRAFLYNNSKWLVDECGPLMKNHAVVYTPKNAKAFTTRKAAEKYAARMNKGASEICFIHETEDGYLLFEGDKYHKAYLWTHPVYNYTQWYLAPDLTLKKNHAVVDLPQENRAFHSLEKAKQFMSVMNAELIRKRSKEELNNFYELEVKNGTLNFSKVDSDTNSGGGITFKNAALEYVKVDLGSAGQYAHVYPGKRVMFHLNGHTFTIRATNIKQIFHLFNKA